MGASTTADAEPPVDDILQVSNTTGHYELAASRIAQWAEELAAGSWQAAAPDKGEALGAWRKNSRQSAVGRRQYGKPPESSWQRAAYRDESAVGSSQPAAISVC